jgi:hypothetical protein
MFVIEHTLLAMASFVPTWYTYMVLKKRRSHSLKSGSINLTVFSSAATPFLQGAAKHLNQLEFVVMISTTTPIIYRNVNLLRYTLQHAQLSAPRSRVCVCLVFAREHGAFSEYGEAGRE